MMHSLRQFLRIWHIGVILKRYRLDKLFNTALLPAPIRWLRVFIPTGKDVSELPRGERLRMALQELGPVYVKFGQILSTRRDLLPPDIADELALLQDQVPAFPGDQARDIIEDALGKPVGEIFATFDNFNTLHSSIRIKRSFENSTLTTRNTCSRIIEIRVDGNHRCSCN